MIRARRKVTGSMEAYLPDAGGGFVAIVVASVVIEVTK